MRTFWRVVTILWLMAATGTVAASLPDDLLAEFERLHPDWAMDEGPAIESVPPKVVHAGARDSGQVALTFDACSRWSDNRVDKDTLDWLREHQVPATLFLGGRWMVEHPDLTRELHQDPGFELANHAYAHPDLTGMESDEVSLQIGLAQLVTYQLTGQWPQWFRAPFVRIDDKVTEAAAELALITVQYDVASGDADASASPQQVADHVLDNVRDGSIVVLHMNNPDLPTAEALPKILQGLEDKGLEPVTVGTLLTRPVSSPQ